MTDVILHELYSTPIINKYAQIDKFVEYVIKQWFENDKMPLSYWNINGRGEDDRTNNICEVWHSKFNRQTEANHQHIFK